MNELQRHCRKILGHLAIEVTAKEADVISRHKGNLAYRYEKKYTTLDCGYCPENSACDQVKYDCPKVDFKEHCADESIFSIDLFTKAANVKKVENL